MHIVAKINIDSITNAMVHKKPNLSLLGDRCLEILQTVVLEKYFGEYSASAKFMLEVAYVHPRSYGMLKHKAGLIIATYEEAPID